MPPKTGRVERRLTPGQVELRAKGNKVYIEGHAAVFDKLSQNLGGFVERIQPGAFTKTITEADVRATQNHDENRVLGRNISGTLQLSQDTTGLYYKIDPPDTTYARDLMILLERGDVTQSSFAFFAVAEDWGMTEDDFPRRDVGEAGLVDVSVVTYPAYLTADAGIGQRSIALAQLSKRSGIEIADLSDLDSIKAAVRTFSTEEVAEPERTSTQPDLARWRRQAQTLADLEAAFRSQ